MKNIKIKLTKISELEDALHPHNISEGVVGVYNVREATFKPPELGCRFNLVDNNFRGEYFSTSGVKEIIDGCTFKTYNSIYKWEEID